MTRAEKIVQFIKEAFELLNIDYENFFYYYDSDDNSRYEYPLILPNGKLDMNAVSYAAEILGMNVEDILSRKNSIIFDKLEKYPYIKHRRFLKEAHKASFMTNSYETIHLMEAIFDISLEHLYQKKYDYSDVGKRLVDKLVEINRYIPGTIHEGETLCDLLISTNTFCHFDEITDMVESFLSMGERAKDLFIKAVHSRINTDEILEYNFLVTVLGIRDYQTPTMYLYYDILIKVKDEYSNITDDAFYSVVLFHNERYFCPWWCKEFIFNKELAQRYIDVFPEAKGRMREYAIRTLDFECSFIWSDDLLTPEEQKIWNETDWLGKEGLAYQNPRFENKTVFAYVEKTDAELGEDAEAAKVLRTYCGPQKAGGLSSIKRVTFSEWLDQSGKEYIERMNKLISYKISYNYPERLERAMRSSGGNGNE